MPALLLLQAYGKYHREGLCELSTSDNDDWYLRSMMQMSFTGEELLDLSKSLCSVIELSEFVGRKGWDSGNLLRVRFPRTLL